MLVAPVLVGSVLAGATWWHLLLLVAWLSAYCTFFATGRWLRSHRKARFRPPVVGHAVGLAVLGGGLLLARPGLLRWAPVYALLLVVSLVCSARRADRSWLNDIVTVLAACVMTVVAAGLDRPVDGWWPAGADDPAAWAATGMLAAYFLGTVPYVKSMIRDHGDRRVYRLSVGYHLVLVAAAAGALWHSGSTGGAAFWPGVAGTWAVLVVTVGLLVRATLLPRGGRRRAAVIGAGEVVATLAVVGATLLAVG